MVPNKGRIEMEYMYIYIYTPDVADFKHGIITQNQFRILDNKNYIKINSHIRSLLS